MVKQKEDPGTTTSLCDDIWTKPWRQEAVFLSLEFTALVPASSLRPCFSSTWNALLEDPCSADSFASFLSQLESYLLSSASLTTEFEGATLHLSPPRLVLLSFFVDSFLINTSCHLNYLVHVLSCFHLVLPQWNAGSVRADPAVLFPAGSPGPGVEDSQ